MIAKIQKEFTLTIGTNDTTKTEENLVDAALQLEEYGNSSLPRLRVHIFTKETEEKQ